MIRNSADLLLEGDRSREPSGELGEDFSGSGKCKGPGVARRWPWGGFAVLGMARSPPGMSGMRGGEGVGDEPELRSYRALWTVVMTFILL